MIKLLKPHVGKDPNFFEGEDVSTLAPNSSFFSIIVGSIGAGKSFILHNIMSHEKALRHAFNWVFVVSPSPKDLDLKVPKDRVTKVFDMQWIADKIEWCRKKIQKACMKAKKQMGDAIPATVCFVFDDEISQIAELDARRDTMLRELFFNRRHLFDYTTNDGEVKHLLSASIILTTQHYKMVPLKFRQVCSWLITFAELPEQMHQMHHEMVFGMTWDKFRYLYEKAFAEPHGLIQIRRDLPIPEQVRVGFS